MESKPNACCANCEPICAVKNVMNRSVPAWLNDLCCEQYRGPGITPQMEIDELKSKLAQKERERRNEVSILHKRIAELESKLSDVTAKYEVEKRFCDSLRDSNGTFHCPSVAKPIEVDEYGNPFIAFSGWKIVFKEGLKCNELYVLAQSTDSDGFDFSVEIGHIEDVADKLQAAQDWLNKLVAQCAVMGNSIPQFTKDDISYILNVLDRFTFKNIRYTEKTTTLIAKCEAMLEGVEE